METNSDSHAFTWILFEMIQSRKSQVDPRIDIGVPGIEELRTVSVVAKERTPADATAMIGP